MDAVQKTTAISIIDGTYIVVLRLVMNETGKKANGVHDAQL